MYNNELFFGSFWFGTELYIVQPHTCSFCNMKGCKKQKRVMWKCHHSYFPWYFHNFEHFLYVYDRPSKIHIEKFLKIKAKSVFWCQSLLVFSFWFVCSWFDFIAKVWFEKACYFVQDLFDGSLRCFFHTTHIPVESNLIKQPIT